VGLKPSTNAPESYNADLKGGPNREGIVNINASREQAANVEFPKLFRTIANERHGVSIRYPQDGYELSSNMLGLLRLSNVEVDVVQSSSDVNHWYANVLPYFGKQITESVIESHKMATEGNADYFSHDVISLLKVGTRLCIIRNDGSGSYIGCCSICIKKFGCPGVWLVREQQKDLSFPPTQVLNRMPSRKRGRGAARSLLGGPRFYPSQVVALEPDDTPRQYFGRKDKSELTEFCMQLVLPHSNRK